MNIDRCDDTVEEPRRLVWARQVMEFACIASDDLTEASGTGISPRCRQALIGQMVAHTVGKDEVVRWIDILVMADKESDFQRAVLAAGAR